MKFSDYKHQIKSGDLLIWSDKKSSGLEEVVEKIIRFFTMSEYVHVGIAFCETKRPMIFEAVFPSVRLYPLKVNRPFFHIPMDVEWNDALFTFMMDNIGNSYSVLDAIRGYISKPNPDNQWQCVELASAFYKLAGIDFGEAYTPSTFVDAVLTQKDVSLTLIDKP